MLEDQHEQALAASLGQFDGLRPATGAAVGCYLRVRLTGAGEVQTKVVHGRIMDRLRGAIRSPDVCQAMAQGDIAIALAGCDVDAARKRVGLLTRLIEMDPLLAAAAPAIWTGIAPLGRDGSVAGMRTARLACELATFQDSGHIEVIDL